MKYHVSIIETLVRNVEVDAINKKEAENIVADKYRAGEYILDAGDYVNTEFEVNEI